MNTSGLPPREYTRDTAKSPGVAPKADLYAVRIFGCAGSTNVVPEGIDITTVSLSIQQLTDDNMEEALKGMERAAKQLANFDVDVVYQSGVPPIVARGTPGFANELQDRLEQACGLPCITDMAGVVDAMHSREIRTVAMATPFRQFINDRLVKYLANEQITVTQTEAPHPVRADVVAATAWVGEFSALLVRVIPPAWLYGVFAAGAMLYAVLFGLGAAAYRTLYLRPSLAGDRQ